MSKKPVEQFSCSDCGFIESESDPLIRPSFFGKPLLPVCFDCFMGFFDGLLSDRRNNGEGSSGPGENVGIQKSAEKHHKTIENVPKNSKN